jgi:hypothetical protein
MKEPRESMEVSVDRVFQLILPLGVPKWLDVRW